MNEVQRAVEILRPVEHILVFTGAGISTESGIPDFRGPNGLWTKVDPDDFHIDRYIANRDLRIRGWEMHAKGELWGARSSLKPNPGHFAVGRLAEQNRLAGVVTQNIDGLHLAAGLDDDQVAELHGNVRESYCLICDTSWPTETVLEWVEAGSADPKCPVCEGIVKTRTVMFGEALPEVEVKKANLFLNLADAVIVAGSTVAVWPASDVVMRAAMRPMPIVIVNKGETEADGLASLKIDAGIGETLPQIIEGILF